MSTPDQPGSGKLTRRQLRELRRTGLNPVIDSDGVPAEPPSDEDVSESREAETADAPADDSPATDESAAVEDSVQTPVAENPVAEAPVEPAPSSSADEAVDVDARPLTRREAREQERLRTNSVPVVAPSHELVEDTSVSADSGTIDVEAMELDTSEVAAARQSDAHDADSNDSEAAQEEATEPDDRAADDAAHPWSTAADRSAAVADERSESDAEVADAVEADEADADEAESRPTVGAAFGIGVLTANEPTKLAPSFDELITKPSDSGGSVSTPNALILPQLPGRGALGGPVSATGEVIITSAHSLDGFGSQGHAKGTADGKDVDSVLLDGEIPLASSPTPIAASSAVSTSKSPGEVIRPPAPEKGGRLMFALAITAGVLGVALIGVLVVAWISGAFS